VALLSICCCPRSDGVSLGSGELRCGEYSVGGNTGCMLEDRPIGDEGRIAASGGGVADIARGDEWFDGNGDSAGEDG